MDTDELSEETYFAILETTEDFHHDLTLQFGLLSYSCDSEDNYLDLSESMINEWLSEWDIEELMMDIFLDDMPEKQKFIKTLETILSNIIEVRKIPIEQRHFDD